jgi:hypothetical protein
MSEYRISQEQLHKIMQELCPSDHPDRNGRTWDNEATERAVNEWLKNNKGTKLVAHDEEEPEMLNEMETNAVTDSIQDLNITLEEYNKCTKLLGEDKNAAPRQFITCAMNKVFDDVHTHEIFDGLTRDTKNKLIDAMTEVLQEVIKEDSKKLKKYLYQRS